MSAANETTKDYSPQHLANAPVDTRSITPGARVAFTDIQVLLGVGVLGVLIVFVGAIAFAFRVKLAELFLGARVWFNLPMTDMDSLKVLYMTIETLGILAWGILTAGIALVYAFVKWTQSQGNSRAQQS